jgi:quercetin dioxygenase-like cupin family protein
MLMSVAASVTFEPGASSAWHAHVLGQTLIVTDGTGWTLHRGGPAQAVDRMEKVSDKQYQRR